MTCTHCKEPIKKAVVAMNGGVHTRCAMLILVDNKDNHYEAGTLGWLLRQQEFRGIIKIPAKATGVEQR